MDWSSGEPQWLGLNRSWFARLLGWLFRQVGWAVITIQQGIEKRLGLR